MNRPLLETRHLVLLATLDEVGSLNAAGRKLHLSASALSQQLREVEERLGGPLFHRRWRKLVLTGAGRRLTDAAHSLLRELTRAETDARSLLNGASGTIRIATVCHQSYRWLPAVLARFAKSWPNVEVTIVTEAALAPYQWLLERRLDLALIASEIKLGPRARVTPLFRDELVALVGREHPWFGRRSIAVNAFSEQHLWADEGALAPNSALGRALAQAGNLAPRKFSVVPMGGVAPIEMARANLGVTVMPRWILEPWLASGDLAAVRIGPRGLWLRWALATRAEQPEPALAAFIEALVAGHRSAPAAATAPETRRDR